MRRQTQAASAADKRSFALAPDAGTALQFTPGERLVWKATGATTGGELDVCELTAQPQAGPPEHIHHQNDEAFVILAGTFRFKVGDELMTASAGTFVFVPRGTAHAWKNVGVQPGHMLLVYTPGGMDRYFAELQPLMFGPPDMPQIQAIAHKYHVAIVGPMLGQ
jgi:quercetin dioxygenase-like cupin family protein